MELRDRKSVSLKDKFKEHYHNRDFTPTKTQVSGFGMGFFGFMVISLLLEAQFVLVPTIYSEDAWKFWLITSLIWLVFLETVSNWYLSYWDVKNYVKSETRAKYFSSEMIETPPGWITCPKCQVDAPPRSHHCNHCGKCILKRDQHCFFTGSCIGFFNQKYFVVFSFYVALGSAFAIYLQISYLSHEISLLSWDIFTYFIPVTLVQWLLGNVTLGKLFIIIHMYLCVTTMCMAAFVFLWQILIITYGATSFEAWKQIFVYTHSAADNFSSVFGSLKVIPILFFFPIKVEQDSDGIMWEVKRKRVKGH
ncbi:hypothetical protein ACJMK2_037186 [Sinanodonta woodiana]|uniref:Palmitoyltransferase n=1 Tax=Sinanodonta woodiana TaxID=1069815 RepID=A0ABD3WN11_SINWO